MVLERIKTIREGRAAGSLREANLAQRGLIVGQANEKLRREAEDQKREERRDAHRRTVSNFINASNVLTDLQEIERSLRGTVPKVALVINLDEEEITLAWGNKFSVEDNNITYQPERRWWGKMDGIRDYSEIHVKVFPDKNEFCIHINSDPSESGWADISEPDKITDYLARAFLNPVRYCSWESEIVESWSSTPRFP